jgi:hypothetical protein
MPKAEIMIVGLAHPYQWLKGVPPSPLEIDQRQRFIDRVQAIIQRFQPNIVADETPDTDNPELLALLPMKPIPIDIPELRKQSRRFNIQRCIHFVCPYVDSVRERYWRFRLHHLVKGHPNPQVLMFTGAKHLDPCFERISFPDLLTRAGHSVTFVNLYEEPGWDHSWTRDWRHPVIPCTGLNLYNCCAATGTYQCTGRCERKIYWKEFLAQKAEMQSASKHA